MREGGTSALLITARVQALHTYVAHLARGVVERSEKQQAAAARVVELEFYSKLQSRRIVDAQPAQCVHNITHGGVDLDNASGQHGEEEEPRVRGEAEMVDVGLDSASGKHGAELTRMSGGTQSSGEVCHGEKKREAHRGMERTKAGGGSERQVGETGSAERGEPRGEAPASCEGGERLGGDERGMSTLQELHVDSVHLEAFTQQCMQRMAANL
jgi:hypothetical protein